MRGDTKLILNCICIIVLGFWIGRWSTSVSLRDVVQDQKKKEPEINDQAFFSSNVTVVYFCNDEKACESLHRFVSLYPKVKVLVGVAKTLKDITFKPTVFYIQSGNPLFSSVGFIP